MAQELPFMASENIIIAMVKLGANRQVRPLVYILYLKKKLSLFKQNLGMS